MDRIHFVLGAGTYPHITGGMEIFNYYLIQSLKDKFNISYTASHSLDIPDTKQIRSYKIRPTKYIFPIQLFLRKMLEKLFFLILHRMLFYGIYITKYVNC